MVINIFGDSIAQGFWDNEGGWVDRLRKHVMNKDAENGHAGYHGVFNLGIDANFTKDVVRRFNSEVTARRFEGADKNDDYVLVFSIGINDTFYASSGVVSTPERYLENLEELLSKSKQLTSRIVFLNLIPVDEENMNDELFDEGLYYTNERIELFNEVLETFCRDNRLTLVDIRDRFLKENGMYSFDGTHPSPKGHKEIFTAVLDVLTPWLYPGKN